MRSLGAWGGGGGPGCGIGSGLDEGGGDGVGGGMAAGSVVVLGAAVLLAGLAVVWGVVWHLNGVGIWQLIHGLTVGFGRLGWVYCVGPVRVDYFGAIYLTGTGWGGGWLTARVGYPLVLESVGFGKIKYMQQGTGWLGAPAATNLW